jgi:hypothetical protein
MPRTLNQSLSKKSVQMMFVASLFIAVGLASFLTQVLSGNTVKAWQAYLVNFLLFTAIAHGALLFSTLMHAVGARWGGPLSDAAEAFSAFFPVSFFLFLGLFWSKGILFPWLGQELHGKEVWLNLWFLFFRDLAAILILYAVGFAYLYHVLWFKIQRRGASGSMAVWLKQRWMKNPPDEGRFLRRRTLFSYLYMLVFAIVLSLLGYDLVMSTDPHWYSTLFGAYSFVKAIYVGFGAVIIFAAVLHSGRGNGFSVKPAQFHDIGKLFFAFGLV